jgi:hypothetical protein
MVFNTFIALCYYRSFPPGCVLTSRGYLNRAHDGSLVRFTLNRKKFALQIRVS